MAEVAGRITETLREKYGREYMESLVIHGILLYGGDFLSKLIRENAYKTIEKNAKQHSDALVKGALSLATQFIRDSLPERLQVLPDVLGGQAIQSELQVFIDKKPYIVALDSTTLEFFNFDANGTITYSIDGGSAQTVNADSNGYAKVTLTTALSSGDHTISAMSKTKAVSVKVKV